MNILQLLKNQLKPATGCTEPVAVGLATSLAFNAAFGKVPSWIKKNVKGEADLNPEDFLENIKEVTVEVDRNVYKNSLATGVPGSGGQSGIHVASALGIFCDPEKKLNLFEDSNEEKIKKANKLIKERRVKIKLVDTWKAMPDLRIYASVKLRINSSIKKGVAVIQHTHTNVMLLKQDRSILYRKFDKERGVADSDLKELSRLTIKDMVKIVEKITEVDANLVWKAIEMNQKVYEFGLKNSPGLGIGSKLQKLIKKGKIKKDMVNSAKIKLAAAEDARMSGQDVQVMSIGGSGSHGLASTIPIMAVADEIGTDKEKLIKATTLSILVTLYSTYYLGYLSALCGVVIKSCAGAAAGITYYLGGNEKQVGLAIKNLLADITGVICDGGKIGCALKVATGAGVAVQSALLALEDIEVPSDNGIVVETPEDTINNVGKISKGMIPLDKSIIEIMKNKRHNKLLR